MGKTRFANEVLNTGPWNGHDLIAPAPAESEKKIEIMKAVYLFWRAGEETRRRDTGEGKITDQDTADRIQIMSYQFENNSKAFLKIQKQVRSKSDSSAIEAKTTEVDTDTNEKKNKNIRYQQVAMSKWLKRIKLRGQSCRTELAYGALHPVAHTPMKHRHRHQHRHQHPHQRRHQFQQA